MDFEHTVERDDFISACGKVILNACPGSGKTTTIAFKLARLAAGWTDRYQGIACLSFTNVAKDEINQKYTEYSAKRLSYPHIVSTIDSFINQFVTLPFYSLFWPGFVGRPRIIDDPSFLDAWSFPYGLQKRRKNGSTFKLPIHYSYPPSSIDFDIGGNFTFEGSAPNLTGSDMQSFIGYCNMLKKKQFERGLLKNSDSTYIAFCILKKHPELARMLASRFGHIIIDEAQDISDLQYGVLDELIANGLSNIELVGDPYQSLYEWREARPDLFMERFDSNEWRSLNLTECRRSTQTIVNCYGLLRRQKDPALTSVAAENGEPINVFLFDDYRTLLQEFEALAQPYDSRKIVVRGKTQLESFHASPVKQLLWKISPCVPNELIQGYYEIQRGGIKNAIDRVRKCLPVLIEPESKEDYRRQLEILEEIAQEKQWNVRIMRLMSSLPSFALCIREWSDQVQQLCKEMLQVEKLPQFELKAGNLASYHRKTVQEVFQGTPNSDKVTTIHQVKGKTFDSLMLVLSSDSIGQKISLRNVERSIDFPDEKKRLIYVAMSRPRLQLVIAIPIDNGVTAEQVKQTFGPDVIVRVLKPAE